MRATRTDIQRGKVGAARDQARTALDHGGRKQLNRLESLRSLVPYAVAVGIQALIVGPIAFYRTLDGDEGAYATASALVADGRVPYEDFWYPQTPGVPYVYGSWTKLFGESWYNLRLLSLLFAIAIGLLLYSHVSRRCSSRRLALVAVLLYASSTYVFVWYTTVKSYALSTMLLFAAYVVVADADQTGEDRPPSRGRWITAGVLLGFAIGVRLLFAPLVAVFALYALRSGSLLRARVGALGSLGCGLFGGLLPTLYFFALDPGRFYWDIVGYQRVRGGGGAAVGDKLRVLGVVLSNPQFIMLAVAALGLAIFLMLGRRRLPLAIALAATLGVASAYPSPAYDQYFVTLVPFLIVGTIELVRTGRRESSSGADSQVRRLACSVGVALVVLYLAAGAYSMDRMRNWDLTFYRLSTVRAIADVIDENTRPGEAVLSAWPGYLYETHAQPVRGFENNFGPLAVATAKLSPKRAASYRLRSYDDMERVIRSRKVRVIVWGGYGQGSPTRSWPEIITEAGYQMVETVQRTSIYLRR